MNFCKRLQSGATKLGETLPDPLGGPWSPRAPRVPPRALPEPSLSRCLLPDASSQMPSPRGLFPDAPSQMPPPRCLLPHVSSQMPHPRCLLPDAFSQMPSPRCILPDVSSQMHPPRCFLPDAFSQMPLPKRILPDNKQTCSLGSRAGVMRRNNHCLTPNRGTFQKTRISAKQK
jgi:hypothetical protein